jgi:hypothetical protein
MDTIFVVTRSISDLKADLKAGRITQSPCNFDDLSDFKKFIRNSSASDPDTTLGYKVKDEGVMLGIKDEVLIENHYYKAVWGCTYEFDKNRLVYHLEMT